MTWKAKCSTPSRTTVAEGGEEEDKPVQLMGGTIKAHNVHIKM